MPSPFADMEACGRREVPGAGERARDGGKNPARLGDGLSERASAKNSGTRVPELTRANSSGDGGGNAALESSTAAASAGGSG